MAYNGRGFRGLFSDGPDTAGNCGKMREGRFFREQGGHDGQNGQARTTSPGTGSQVPAGQRSRAASPVHALAPAPQAIQHTQYTRSSRKTLADHISMMLFRFFPTSGLKKTVHVVIYHANIQPGKEFS